MANSMVPSIKEIPINRGEQHLAVCIALDNSYSLSSQAHELNDGLRLLIEEINRDAFTRGRVDLCILTFNDSVHKLVPFTPAPNCEVPASLRCEGTTAMYEALDVSLKEIEKRNALYAADKIPHYHPWLFLLTDGCPTDTDTTGVTQRLLQAQSSKELHFFPIGIGDADFDFLKKFIIGSKPLRGTKEDIENIFRFISSSVVRRSSVPKGQSVTLKPGEYQIDVVD